MGEDVNFFFEGTRKEEGESTLQAPHQDLWMMTNPGLPVSCGVEEVKRELSVLFCFKLFFSFFFFFFFFFF